MARDTMIFKAAAIFGENLVHVVVGAVFIGGGGWLVRYALQQKPQADKLLYIGLGVAIFGALLMPTILPLVKQIVVVVQGVPVLGAMLGGRRATDPQPTPPPSGDVG